MIESIKPSHSFPRGGFSFLLFFFPLWVAFSACKLLWGSYDFFFFSFSKPFTYLPIYLPTYISIYSILFYSILFYSILLQKPPARWWMVGSLKTKKERARLKRQIHGPASPEKQKRKIWREGGWMDGWMRTKAMAR